MDGTFRATAVELATAADQDMKNARPLFASDARLTEGRTGHDAGTRLLAELILHDNAETPFCIGLFGAPGAGKTRMIEGVVAATEQLAAAAAEAGLATPFVAELLVVRVDCGGEDDPAALLGGAVFDRLAVTSPVLAAELRHAGADPAEAARAAGETLDETRRRLDAGRQALETLSGRDARLAESVLETPGSRVDSYARAKRYRLEGVLAQFGFDVTDPVATYKEFVRHAAEGAAGGVSQTALALRSLYAYKGQTRLILSAVVLLALAWGCSLVRGNQASWVGSLRGTGEGAAQSADWIQAHLPWLGPIETGLLVLAVLLLLLNLWRAARFVLPVSRGIDLLQQDLESRRRELSSLIAHATRRVDALSAEAELASRAAAEAERRAGRPGQIAGALRPSGLTPSGSAPAAFFRALARAMAEASAGAPRRILVAIDGLDGRSPGAAAGILAAVRSLFGPGLVTVVAVSPHHLMAGFSETDPAAAAAQLARCVQVPYRVGVAEASDSAKRAYAASLIDGAGSHEEPAVDVDARQSLLQRPWQPREAETLAALAPFAGETPRAVKRLVNLYRIARADVRLRDAPRPVFTALALALALDAHGFPDDLTALERASHGEAPGDATVLRRALAVAREASGELVELGQAQRALDVAASYSSRP